MKKNILVVDDSALMRRVICDIINSDERFHVLNKAIDGIQALEYLRMYDYDAVVLDVNMPNMNGLELMKELQKYQINAKVMMASSGSLGGAEITMEALSLGALDFISKPNNVADCKGEDFKENLLRTLAAVSGARVGSVTAKALTKAKDKPLSQGGSAPDKSSIARSAEPVAKDPIAKESVAKDPRSKDIKPKDLKAKNLKSKDTGSKGLKSRDLRSKDPGAALEKLRKKEAEAKKSGEKSIDTSPAVMAASSPVVSGEKPIGRPGTKLVAIASSTGGPKALHPVITSLPKDLAAPVVLVQHMPQGFTKSLADRLNAISEVDVKEAREGESLISGKVYISKGGKHLNIDYAGGQYKIRYSDEPSREGVKPCANYMYESLANSGFEEIICVVLTGMGADGTEGIMNLKKSKKIKVIVQEKSTCAVYGMPKSVVSAGLADSILPLDRIAQEIVMNVGVK